ncbi:hypothetical protein ACLB2K_020710 [Fragaria x ananassa]
MHGLTHIGATGEAQMVDVSPKPSTKRTAVSSCKVLLGKKVFDLVLANQMAQGDVLSVAKIAGINGAKNTSNLIPLCHNISLIHVRVDLTLNPKDFSVDIEAEASSTGKTGIEMEAMTAASVAGLTVYDMCKAASKSIQITDIRLESKAGGKSGDWHREETEWFPPLHSIKQLQLYFSAPFGDSEYGLRSSLLWMAPSAEVLPFLIHNDEYDDFDDNDDDVVDDDNDIDDGNENIDDDDE